MHLSIELIPACPYHTAAFNRALVSHHMITCYRELVSHGLIDYWNFGYVKGDHNRGIGHFMLFEVDSEVLAQAPPIPKWP